VFQNFGLLPWKTVEENVALGLVMRKEPHERIQPAVRKALEQVGLWEWRSHKPEDLSGGMKQRVGIARVLCMDTDVILLDEPFSALDPIIRMKLQNDLLELQHTLRKTMVLVTHDLTEAIKMAQHIAVMQEGALVQMGTPHNILTSPATEYVHAFVQSVQHQASFLKASPPLAATKRFDAIYGHAQPA
jgi:glycine betaine/proline transport system ATP-binding protein